MFLVEIKFDKFMNFYLLENLLSRSNETSKKMQIL